MAEADELCDRVAIIDRGKILACDTPFSLKHALQRDAIFRLQLDYLPDGAEPVCTIEGVQECTVRHFQDRTELSLILKAENVLAEVINRLSAQHASLLSLEKREPTLEDVFVKLVGRGLDEDTGDEDAGG
jgi:ABC-2 type transport system ATP-binding protein